MHCFAIITILPFAQYIGFVHLPLHLHCICFLHMLQRAYLVMCILNDLLKSDLNDFFSWLSCWRDDHLFFSRGFNSKIINLDGRIFIVISLWVESQTDAFRFNTRCPRFAIDGDLLYNLISNKFRLRKWTIYASHRIVNNKSSWLKHCIFFKCSHRIFV